jgi:transposase
MLHWAPTPFAAWRANQSGLFDHIALQQALLAVRLALHEVLQHGAARAWTKLQATCQDLLQHWEALWTFSRMAGLHPTNNLAERALRGAVIWRKRCYGTQRALGSRVVEWMLSVRATCARQGRNLFGYCRISVLANRTQTINQKRVRRLWRRHRLNHRLSK